MPDESKLPSDRAAFESHIARFEAWFVAKQKEHGMEGQPLIQVERAILMSYLTWLMTVRAHAHDQTK